jgi:DNA-binding PadR family transcriptional regulator
MGLQHPTLNELKVISALLEAPASDRHYGADLMRRTQLSSGVMYPILGRLEHVGVIFGEWEMIDESRVKRRRRRYYSLTPTGESAARQVLLENLRLLGVRTPSRRNRRRTRVAPVPGTS